MEGISGFSEILHKFWLSHNRSLPLFTVKDWQTILAGLGWSYGRETVAAGELNICWFKAVFGACTVAYLVCWKGFF